MKISIFSTPILTPCLRLLANAGLRLSGWKVLNSPPIPPPYVLIAAPHTSNWDFLLMLAVVFHLKMDIHWMGKHTLFPPFIAPISRWLGGIAINRKQSHNAVSQMVGKFSDNHDLVMLIAPEGTRKQVAQWKTGFYHIAQQANVPIVMGCINAEHKQASILGVFNPTGDIERELTEIQQHFHDCKGIKQSSGE